MLDVKQWSTEWAGRTLTFEVGKLALMATSSLTVQYGETKLLITVVKSSNIRAGIDYFPLSVEFQEKFNAAGKIKGSRFVKVEGRPSDESMLTGRIIDRSIRPLFDQTIREDLQVVVTPLSLDKVNDPAVLGLVGASAALAISSIPFDGTIGAARVTKVDGEFVLNPNREEIAESGMDVFVAGSPEKLIMVEAAGNEMPDADVYEAMKWGCDQLSPVIDIINTMVKEVGADKILEATDGEVNLAEQLKAAAKDFFVSVADTMMFDKERKGKKERVQMIDDLKVALKAHLIEKGFEEDDLGKIISEVKYMIADVVSKRILDSEQRLDGRKLDEVRDLHAEIDFIPRVHGSSLFMRGDTQVLNTIALGAPGDVQLLDTMQADDATKRFFHHYFDAPFTYGEAGFFRGPSRRAIGHGALAEKAMLPVLPPVEDFPYTIRAVSEIMGSNGSSSMASACSTSLALMAAGVPITNAVAGIAMGLSSEMDEHGTITRYKVLTDLQDVEDGNGGMDFKIAGTVDGITAVQMDTKTKGLNWDIVQEAVTGSSVARKHILGEMAKAIAEPRAELSEHAPRIITMQINPEKIGDIIGPGGKTIKKIVEETGVDIDIEQDGRVLITSKDAEGTDKAIAIIKDLTREIEAGEIFEEGKVVRIEDFGAFVELVPGKDGLVHVSEISWERTEKVSDVLKMGQIVKVKVKEIDSQGRVALTIKGLMPKPEGYTPPAPRSSGPRSGGGGNRGPRKPYNGGGSKSGGSRPSGDRPAPKAAAPAPAAAPDATDKKKGGLFGFGKK
jgi:polyribonucleotide nucleotidyltransferase